MKVTPHVVLNCCTERFLGADPQLITRRSPPNEAILLAVAIAVGLGAVRGRRVGFSSPRNPAVTVNRRVSGGVILAVSAKKKGFYKQLCVVDDDADSLLLFFFALFFLLFLLLLKSNFSKV